jgi:hypothetical protein
MGFEEARKESQRGRVVGVERRTEMTARLAKDGYVIVRIDKERRIRLWAPWADLDRVESFVLLQKSRSEAALRACELVGAALSSAGRNLRAVIAVAPTEGAARPLAALVDDEEGPWLLPSNEATRGKVLLISEDRLIALGPEPSAIALILLCRLVLVETSGAIDADVSDRLLELSAGGLAS